MKCAKDIHNKITVVHLLDAQAYTVGTTKTSWIDTKGLQAVEFIVNVGVVDAAVAVAAYEHSTTADSGATAVATADMEGTFTAITGTGDDQTTVRSAYKGNERYVGLNIAFSGNAVASADAILTYAEDEPVAAHTATART
jgi:hypothetical protein